ncbi:substrate-binding domain-containing protein, partial [Streptomyces sp. MBT60]|uniref:substrate-binding domain-containing protein n=1 Tax=Streptomyces sp. MBT60 TaxID=2800409 RepID=UPI001F2D7B87
RTGGPPPPGPSPISRSAPPPEPGTIARYATPPEPGTIARSGTPPEPGTIARSGTPPEPGTIARPGPGLLVAACVDGPATRGAEPPVTAVDLRPAAYGRACAELLCDILADRAAPDTVRRHAWSLETRASTGSPG